MKSNNILMAIICFLIVPMSGLCIDLYIPSLPSIEHAFLASEALTNYSISFYLLSFGICQLFVGPITDAWGRKKPMLIGLSLFSIVSLMITLCTNIYVFLIFRMLQGLSIALTGVAARAIIPDLFKGDQYRKMMNYMTIIWSLGPIVAPFIGGYLQNLWGWKAAFYFFAIYGVVSLALVMGLYRETIASYSKLSFRYAFFSYVEMMLHRSFLLGTICLGLLYSFLVIFSVVGVFIIESSLHYSAIDFGYIALIMGFGWFLGNMTNRFLLRLGEKFNQYKMYIAMLISTIACTVLMVISSLIGQGLLSLSIFMFISIYFAGIVFPNFFASCIGYFAHKAGSASALMGSFFILLTSLFTFIFGAFQLHSVTMLALIILIFSAICFMLIFMINYMHKNNVLNPV